MIIGQVGMYYFFADRAEWLRLLPKGGRWAEIGVFAGDNAARILKLCEPSELHLIDPWHFDLDFDWFNPPEWSPLYGDARRLVRQLSDWAQIPEGRHVNEHFERLHRAVVQRYAGDPRVTIHRAASREVARSIPDRYFDFVYIDGDHRYEAVLADLILYDPKLSEKGIFLGDDFCDHGASENAEYGVVAAVNKFIKRTGPRTLLLNSEVFSFFALFKGDTPEGARLLQTLIESEIFFIEISDALIANYHHKPLIRTNGTVRLIPAF